MRNLFGLFLIIGVAVGCKTGDGEKRSAIKAEMQVFEKEWAATAEMYITFGLDMDKTLKTMNADSLSIFDDSVKTGCNALKTEYDVNWQQWLLDEKTYNDWKKMFNDRTMNLESATNLLKQSKGQLEKYNALLEEWKRRLELCRPAGDTKGRV